MRKEETAMKKASFRRLTALLAVLTLLFALPAGAETRRTGTTVPVC